MIVFSCVIPTVALTSYFLDPARSSVKSSTYSAVSHDPF